MPKGTLENIGAYLPALALEKMKSKGEEYRKELFRSYITQPLSLLLGGVVVVLGLLFGLAAGSLLVGAVALAVLLLVYGSFIYSRAESSARKSVFSDWAQEYGWQHQDSISPPGGAVFQIADKQEFGDFFSGITIDTRSARMFNFDCACMLPSEKRRSLVRKKKNDKKTREEKSRTEVVPCLVLQIDVALPLKGLTLVPKDIEGPLSRTTNRLLSLFADRHEIDIANHALGGQFRMITTKEDTSAQIASALKAPFVDALLANPEPPQIIDYENGRLTILMPYCSVQSDDTEQATWILARGQQLLLSLEG